MLFHIYFLFSQPVISSRLFLMQQLFPAARSLSCCFCQLCVRLVQNVNKVIEQIQSPISIAQYNEHIWMLTFHHDPRIILHIVIRTPSLTDPSSL